MKKFGTPIAAGPGSENEKVGLAGVGAPPLVVVAVGLLELEEVLVVLVEVLPPPGCEDGCSGEPGPVVCGARVVLVRVVEVEVLDREERELALELELELEVVVEDEVVVEGAAAQVSLSEAIPTLTGSEIDDRGVPGGTLTVKVSFWPVMVVTVTTHVSASATGIAARASTANTALTVPRATTILRLFNTVT
jgi:hypothetical protein